MSSTIDIFSKFPRQIPVKSNQTSYILKPGYYAAHGKQPPAETDPVQLLNDGAIAIYEGDPPTAFASMPDRLSPIYTLAQGGSLAVPTGLVLLRLGEHIPIADRLDAVEAAGYEVAETLSYAPNAAWLRARSGKIADALAGTKELEKIPGVENVEPQMLMASSRR